MDSLKFSCVGQTKALEYAADELQRQGCILQSAPVDFLLTDVPVRQDLSDILQVLPPHVVVVGGNLQGFLYNNRKTIDLLQDPVYVAQNASITAHCAVKLMLNQLPVSLVGLPVLIVGWGRIGKCLADLLRKMGARVSVFARKEADNGMLSALGYSVGNLNDLHCYRIIVNTAPAMVLDRAALSTCRQDCLKIDLASVPGMEGEDIIWARGLPGKEMPESSGLLIAQRTIHYMKGVLT